MASPGFRIFLASAQLEGCRKGFFDFVDNESNTNKHFAFYFASVLQQSQGVILEGLPSLSTNGKGQVVNKSVDRMNRCRIEDVKHETKTNVVHVRFRYGWEGDFDKILDSVGEQSLSGKATTRTYRISFYFPQLGEQAIVVSECVGRTHATEMLTRWFFYKSVELVNSNSCKVAWKIKVESYYDSKQLNQLLGSSSTYKLVLKGQGRTKSGLSARSGKPVVVEEKVEKGQSSINVASLVKRWIKGQGRQGGKLDTTGVEDVKNEMSLSTLNPKDFSDGEIIIEDSNNKTVRVSPSRLDETYIYPLIGRHPSKITDAEWLQQTSSKVKSVSVEESIQI